MTSYSIPDAGCTCGCHRLRTSLTTAAWMTPEQVVEYVHGAVTVGTLRNYRSARIGPRYRKVGRAVFYTVDSIHDWLAELSRDDDLRWNDNL